MTHFTPARAALLPLALLLPAMAFADSGPYVSGSIGSASLDENIATFSIDDDTEAFRLLGGWQFGEVFGIEAGYQNFGDFEETIDLGGTTAVTTLTAEGWTIGGTLGGQFSDTFSWFGRAGVFLWEADVDVNGIAQAIDDDSNPYYGAGARLALSRNFSLIGDWTRYELDDVDTDVISIGFQYRFGL